MGPRHLSRGIGNSDKQVMGYYGRFNGATASEPWNPAITMSVGTTPRLLQWGHGI